jgi:hypothetical protein
VLQPVIQFGTAVHGKGLSGGTLNRVQEPLRAQINPLRPAKNYEIDVMVFLRSLANSPVSNTVAAVTGRLIACSTAWVNRLDSYRQRHMDNLHVRAIDHSATNLNLGGFFLRVCQYAWGQNFPVPGVSEPSR